MITHPLGARGSSPGEDEAVAHDGLELALDGCREEGGHGPLWVLQDGPEHLRLPAYELLEVQDDASLQGGRAVARISDEACVRATRPVTIAGRRTGEPGCHPAAWHPHYNPTTTPPATPTHQRHVPLPRVREVRGRDHWHGRRVAVQVQGRESGAPA